MEKRSDWMARSAWECADIQLFPLEIEERLRELYLKQREINSLLDFDKSDIQAESNDNTPLEDQAAGTFVERLEAWHTERRQVKDLEIVA